MSDMFDHALDALESQIEYDMWGMRSPKYKTLNEMCRFCGEMKVMWRKFDFGWRLVMNDDPTRFHFCPVYRRKP